MKHNYIANSHARISVKFTHGKGMYLYANEGKFLDFMSGVAVNSLGHCHKDMVKAIADQSKKMWHVSNIFYTDIMEDSAQTICKASGMERVFFSNSGSEAMETAIKMMRKFFQEKGQNKYEIITLKESFHGRSITNISAAKEPAYTNNFHPLLEGFVQAEYGNIKQIEELINDKTAGIIIEPIQGEGGLNFSGWEYLKDVSNLAKKYGILLTLDEVQCGASRTGKFNAYQWADIQPDIIAMAKGIGGGFPVGATLFAKTTKDVITVGSHGTTFGGNPMAMAVVNTVCKKLTDDKFLENINKQAKYLNTKLNNLQKKFPHIIKEIRGFGLMTGFSLQEKFEAKKMVDKLFENKLMTMTARQNVVRLLPPLILQKKHIDEAIAIIEKTFHSMSL